MPETAFIVLDAQVNMFDEQAALHRGPELLGLLGGLLTRAREAGALVVHVQNDGPPGEVDEPGTPGWAIHPDVAPEAGEVVLSKQGPDAFAGGTLAEELGSRGVQRVVVAGLQSDMCVPATVKGAADQGLAVTLVADAHSTFDGGRSAADLVADANTELALVAQVVPSGDVRFAVGD